MEEKEFQVIETQEQLNNVIKDRISRERAKFADYDELKAKSADYESQIAALNSQIEEATGKVSNYEKDIADRDAKISAYEMERTKLTIAIDSGLPLELASRLNGSTEEELRADAQTLAGMMKRNSNPAPLRDPETNPPEDGVLAAFRSLNPKLKF